MTPKQASRAYHSLLKLVYRLEAWQNRHRDADQAGYAASAKNELGRCLSRLEEKMGETGDSPVS